MTLSLSMRYTDRVRWRIFLFTSLESMANKKITYPHPDLEPILQPTYGVLIYQEQIMQIAHQIAGFSLGGSRHFT
ncbi:hypothetical protein RWE15_25110 [Virgibacillus halophilus]|uniref:DNA polymerase III alpha subunit finger domain-containing protein n=1 Tax=Tigheibacillus halophilus TaxID=361280 RepID=A0ABU5CCM2_9BACI|nr:hypothetical protein [Virgibacillus halophilus]